MNKFYEIQNINSPELSIFSALSENQLAHINEPDLGLFIAESSKVIVRAVETGYIPVSMLIESGEIDKEAKSAIEICGDVPVYVAGEDVFSNITGYKLTRGALCAMKRQKLVSSEELLDDVLSKQSESGKTRIAVLEDVMNPTNLGAIFRCAAAMNVDAVLLTRGCTDPLYRRAIRVSMGTVFQIPWTYFENDNWQDMLRNKGYKMSAMALRNDTVDITDESLKQEQNLAIILGTEGEGLREETIDGADYTIKIPMYHSVDSLNVAAAAGIAFWELAGRDEVRR